MNAIKARMENAVEWFVGIVVDDINCSRDDALKIMDLYVSNKLMKLDVAMGKFKVKTPFFEQDVLLNALDMVRN